MFDVFYYGIKPELFAHEVEARDLEHAAELSRTKFYWFIYGDNDYSNFDFDYIPPPWEEEHLHVWPTQWHQFGGAYLVNKDTISQYQYNFKKNIVPIRPEKSKFQELHQLKSFDYTWRPHPKDPPYIYIFGNQHWPAQIMPTVKYIVEGAVEIKYITEPYAELAPTKDNWNTLIDLPFEFDYSWCPDPGDPPYIYHFGNQWYPAEEMPTVEYRVPGATETKYVDSVQARMLPVMDRWNVPEEIDATNIDFSWVPHPKDDPYIHHFGSDYQISTGLTYTVPGAVEPKFEGEPPKLIKDNTAVSVVDIFFVDRGNQLSVDRYKKLQGKYPHIQKIRYANSMLDTVRRCVTRSRTRKFWVVSSLNVYDDFDFAWHAEPWQNYMTHIFPSQWNKWSDTFLINKYEFERHSKWAQGIEEFPNLNFVNNQTVQSSSDGSNIYYVDHGNDNNQLVQLQKKYAKIKVTRFVDNYLDTLKRIMTTADTEYVWIISSICDYETFDFTWHPEAWQAEMIHVFASGMQRRGDTFYIHVESFRKQMYELELLDWFNVINYCEDQRVYRLEAPTIVYQGDSLVDAVKNTAFNFPYAVFRNYEDDVLHSYSNLCLWSAKDRVIQPITSNKSCAVIPRDARGYVKTQLYDYPYILKEDTVVYCSPESDVIFISNGESMAEENWQILKNICPRAKRSDGITGRELAYKTAAQLSTTPWFYAVFAKTEVLPTFKFDFEPDYYQEPKHYIFHSRNPLNGLEYGAMNINLYNKQLVLDTDPGLDFTLSKAHDVIPICASISRFNTDPWITWRSAFREVLKLQREVDDGATIEIEHRLHIWCTVAQGENAEYCLQGAQDALKFYQSVNGDYIALKQSFDWEWCQNYYYSLYKRKLWLEVL